MTREPSIKEIHFARQDVTEAEASYAQAQRSGDYQDIESWGGLLHNRRARLRELLDAQRWARKVAPTTPSAP